MIMVILGLVFAVVVLSWLIAAALFVAASLAGIIAAAKTRDRFEVPPEEEENGALHHGQIPVADAEFLREVGIKM